MVNFWSGSELSEIGIINFTARVLFDLIFTCRPRDVVLLIFWLMTLAYFILLSFFSRVFLLMTYLRGNV